MFRKRASLRQIGRRRRRKAIRLPQAGHRTYRSPIRRRIRFRGLPPSASRSPTGRTGRPDRDRRGSCRLRSARRLLRPRRSAPPVRTDIRPHRHRTEYGPPHCCPPQRRFPRPVGVCGNGSRRGRSIPCPRRRRRSLCGRVVRLHAAICPLRSAGAFRRLDRLPFRSWTHAG